DRFRRLAGPEGQRAALGDVVLVAGFRGVVHGAVRYGHGLVVGGRERDREGEERCVIIVALLLADVGDADPRFVVEDGAHALGVTDRRVGRAREVDGKRFGRLRETVAEYRDRERVAELAGWDGHGPGRGRVVATGHGGDVRRRVVNDHIDVRGEREG